MAIGLGKFFGFDFLENFNYPYISSFITEYWRRWHISLGTWFRDYVYIPLGGNRVKYKWRRIFNLSVVWILTGLWHGASWNFVVWGIWFLIFIGIEKLFLLNFIQDKKILSQIYTLLIVIIGWVLFRSPNLKYALDYFSSIIGLSTTINNH